MTDIILKTNNPDNARQLIKQVIQTEADRLKYSLGQAKQKLLKFETRYGVSSEKFINEWASEDLQGKDMEYIEWAGEFELAIKLKENIATLESIEYVAPQVL